MTLVLSNADAEAVLNISDCMQVLDSAYRDHAAGRAVNRRRTDIYAPHERADAHYVFKSFEGLLANDGIAALRLNSDVIAWSSYAGVLRKDKQPLAGGRWVGLILLFSTTTGEPLAILPDGVVQRFRVGGTNGLAAQRLARADARAYGLLGTGWQAGAQLMAMAAIRELDDVRVYSPNPEHRAKFADEWSEKLGLPISAVDSPEAAVAGVDILGTATNASGTIVKPEWLHPGVHLTCVKRIELGEQVLARCDRVVSHTHEAAVLNFLVGLGDEPVESADPLDLLDRLRAGQPVTPEQIAAVKADVPPISSEPILSDLLTGKAAGRASETEINAFANNLGAGIQFAAVGALVYRKAKERGLGRDLPTEWFTEDVHP